MTQRTATLRRAGVLALGATLLLAGPASAHPFFRGGEVPVESLATLTLAMAHGCDSEDAGEGEPTTDVSLQVPEWMQVVEVADLDGWEVDLEEDDTGRTEVVTWTAVGAEEPAPDFDLDVVVEGEVGEQRHVAVFQACDDFVYRWVGTPEAPAEDPAINLTLAEADPDNPPPPEPEPTEDEATDDEGTDDDATTADEDAPEADEEAAEPDADAPDDAPNGEEPEDTQDVEETDEAEPAEEDEELATDDLAADDGGGATGWIVAALVLVLVAAAVTWVVTRRGRTAEGG